MYLFSRKIGGGYHIYDLGDKKIVQFKRLCYIATILYCPMALFVKISLPAILIQIFAPYGGKVWFIYILLGPSFNEEKSKVSHHFALEVV